MRKIITVNTYPPIPDRRFDWCAYRDGEEEHGHYGWGRTEAEALEDLRRMDDERADDLEGQFLAAAERRDQREGIKS